jgi:hypothetical protein
MCPQKCSLSYEEGIEIPVVFIPNAPTSSATAATEDSYQPRFEAREGKSS